MTEDSMKFGTLHLTTLAAVEDLADICHSRDEWFWSWSCELTIDGRTRGTDLTVVEGGNLPSIEGTVHEDIDSIRPSLDTVLDAVDLVRVDELGYRGKLLDMFLVETVTDSTATEKEVHNLSKDPLAVDEGRGAVIDLGMMLEDTGGEIATGKLTSSLTAEEEFSLLQFPRFLQQFP